MRDDRHTKEEKRILTRQNRQQTLPLDANLKPRASSERASKLQPSSPSRPLGFLFWPKFSAQTRAAPNGKPFIPVPVPISVSVSASVSASGQVWIALTLPWLAPSQRTAGRRLASAPRPPSTLAATPPAKLAHFPKYFPIFLLPISLHTNSHEYCISNPSSEHLGRNKRKLVIGSRALDDAASGSTLAQCARAKRVSIGSCESLCAANAKQACLLAGSHTKTNQNKPKGIQSAHSASLFARH